MSTVIKTFIERQYQICRILAGLFMIYIFASCWLAREALFATQFSVKGSLFETLVQFPFFASEGFLHSAILLGFVSSILFICGIFIRASALSIWIAMVLVYNFNFSVAQFHNHYIAFMLWIYILFSGEPWSAFKSSREQQQFSTLDWKIPFASLVYFTLTMSGLSKALAAKWWTGGILNQLCGLSLVPGMCGLPISLFQVLGIFVLAVEIAAFLYVPIKRIRFLIWLSQFLLYSGIAIMMYRSVFHIALAFLILELFLFDERDLPRWLKARMEIQEKNGGEGGI